MSGRTVLIGDLHGCYAETVALMNKLDLSADDWVIFLGDYVDRGPENSKCCDLVRTREQVQGKVAGILGNHEEKHLIYQNKVDRGKPLDTANMPPTHGATRAQLLPEHYLWMRSLPLYVRLPEHNAVAVHAGVFPGRPIEAQTPQHLLHIQCIRPPAEKSYWPSKVPPNEEGYKFWTNFYDGPEKIVFGHSVLDRPLVTDKVVGIDLGAVFGHKLCAYVLPEGKLVTVDGEHDHGKGSRGRTGDRIKSYEVQDGVWTYS